jgi:hypothetical protein
MTWITDEDRKIYNKECCGKKCYLTIGKARHAANKEEIRLNTKINSYKCNFCFFFHIGHSRKKL